MVPNSRSHLKQKSAFLVECDPVPAHQMHAVCFTLHTTRPVSGDVVRALGDALTVKLARGGLRCSGRRRVARQPRIRGLHQAAEKCGKNKLWAKSCHLIPK